MFSVYLLCVTSVFLFVFIKLYLHFSATEVLGKLSWSGHVKAIQTKKSMLLIKKINSI